MRHPLIRIFTPISLVIAIALSSVTLVAMDVDERPAMGAAPTAETTLARAETP
jgi:hypothetical protein